MWKEFDVISGKKMSTSSHSSDTFNLTGKSLLTFNNL
jgi:hypothetical protein